MIKAAVSNWILKKMILIFFRLSGWKVIGRVPQGVQKAIMVGGGHTSNWDLFMSLGTFFTLDIPFGFMIKKEALRFPVKTFLMSMGAIPIDRRSTARLNYVEQMAEVFAQKDRYFLAMAPEGTRKAVQKWKSGYYHIAEASHVPLILCYLDYEKKEAHVGPVMDILATADETMQALKQHFKAAKPRNPEMFILEDVNPKVAKDIE